MLQWFIVVYTYGPCYYCTLTLLHQADLRQHMPPLRLRVFDMSNCPGNGKQKTAMNFLVIERSGAFDRGFYRVEKSRKIREKRKKV